MHFMVDVLDEASYGRLDVARATELCAAAFSLRGLELDRVGEVSVALVGAGKIQELNLRYRNIDQPTDVLSFEIDGPYGEMAGEIVIAPECASPEMDVEELVIHGALHLSGMDHGEDFETSEMALLQETVMRGIRDQRA